MFPALFKLAREAVSENDYVLPENSMIMTYLSAADANIGVRWVSVLNLNPCLTSCSVRRM
jgi:hypothetical protein